ncbi:unnamed protein product [Clavelina lepadiformis]|uniref:Uncharacterized protein n=1 Tax=Clavelina lepadiformis TaxID=159417 RepID=A0ABP0GBN8_CLALP
MKVICAGMSKTGTKSMQAALKELGYNVYDFMENFEYLHDDWVKILAEGGSTEDFRRMYENVDAVTDIPGNIFWDEIHKAFPEAKIVLTIRDEDKWIDSVENQYSKANKPIFFVLTFFSPTFKKLGRFGDKLACAIFGSASKASLFKAPTINSLLYKMKFRRHNAHVLQNAPKDKLLVFSVSEGWEPLCNFLGTPIPSTSFPRKNVRENRPELVKEYMANNPTFIRAQREMKISFALFVGLLGFGIYKLSRTTPTTWMDTIGGALASLRS